MLGETVRDMVLELENKKQYVGGPTKFEYIICLPLGLVSWYCLIVLIMGGFQ